MGCFSWLDAITKNQIAIGDEAYVLIPEPFREKYGMRIHENSYNGYGEFGGQDVYALVAEWNRQNLNPGMLDDSPRKENFGGLWNFEKENLRREGKTDEEIRVADEEERNKNYHAACHRWARSINRLNDYRNGMPHSKMLQLYDREYLRDIGIDISCYDEQNTALPYPIKITHDKNAVYEDCDASLSDPDQGCQ